MRGITNDWIKSYTYENRKQLVNIDGRASELLDVTRDVPRLLVRLFIGDATCTRLFTGDTIYTQLFIRYATYTRLFT